MISVIIPTYNRSQLLRRAINSVLAQRDVDIEVIVVNDNIEDKSVLNIISELNDNRIRYSPNLRTKGGNGARNTGIILSRGRFIAFLDDDDEWMPDKLKLQMECLDKPNAEYGGVYCGYVIELHGKWMIKNAHKKGDLSYDFLTGNFEFGASSTLVFRKDVLDKIGLLDETLLRNQDCELLIRFFRHYKLGCVCDVLVRVHGHNHPQNSHLYETSKLMYLDKIEESIRAQPLKKQQHIYAFQYRELAVAYGMYHNSNKLRFYLKKSLSYKLLPLTSYICLLLYVFRDITGINLNSPLDKLKYMILNQTNSKSNRVRLPR